MGDSPWAKKTFSLILCMILIFILLFYVFLLFKLILVVCDDFKFNFKALEKFGDDFKKIHTQCNQSGKTIRALNVWSVKIKPKLPNGVYRVHISSLNKSPIVAIFKSRENSSKTKSKLKTEIPQLLGISKQDSKVLSPPNDA